MPKIRPRTIIPAIVLTLLANPSLLSAQTPEPTPPASSSSDELAQLEAAKKLYEAQKAASEAATAAANSKKAEIEAETAAEQAKLGTISGQTDIKGAIQAGTLAPKAEALLLVTKATLDSGRLIANRLARPLGVSGNREVLVLTDKAQLSIGDAVLFDLKADQLKGAAEANRRRFAQCPVPESADREGEGRGIPVATAIGTAVDLAAKLGSYFMTDYSYGEVTGVDPSPDLLAAAVVGNFGDWPRPPAFIIPSHSLISGANALTDLMRPLHDDYLEAIANHEIALKYAEGHGDKSTSAAAACTAVAAAYQKQIGQYEALFTSLTADASEAEPFGVRVIRQKEIQKKLLANPLVLLLTGKQAAAYYTKKNLWTFIGGMPLYTMGGTSTTYTLFEPSTGHVLVTGAVAHHGGYRSVDRVERLINGSNSARPGNAR